MPLPTSRKRRHTQKWQMNRQQQKRDRKIRIKGLVDKLKNVPCRDCGKKYPPYVMDFDHVNGEKYKAISQLRARGISTRRLNREVANCHRERTHQRGYSSMSYELSPREKAI